MADTVKVCDIAIVGGGFIGCYLARALADSLVGDAESKRKFRIVILEQIAKPRDPVSDKRRIVLNQASYEYVQQLAGDLAGIPLTSMTVGSGEASLRLAAADADMAQLGSIVRGSDLQAHAAHAADHQDIEIYYGCELTKITYATPKVDNNDSDSSSVDAVHAPVQIMGKHNGQECQWQAQLIIGADGANSWVRRQAGVGVVAGSRLALGQGNRQQGDGGVYHITVVNYTQAVDVGSSNGQVAQNEATVGLGSANLQLLDTAVAATIPLEDSKKMLVITSPESQFTLHNLGVAEGVITYLQANNCLDFDLADVNGVATFNLQPVRAEFLTAPRILLAGMAANAMLPVAAQAMNSGIEDVQALAGVVPELLAQGEWLPPLADKYAKLRQSKHQIAMLWTMALIDHGPDQAWANYLANCSQGPGEGEPSSGFAKILTGLKGWGGCVVRIIPKKFAQQQVLRLLNKSGTLKRKIILALVRNEYP